MKLSAFYKGLIMALIGFVASTLSEMETFSFAYVAIATGGFTLIYFAKNYLWQSVSVFGFDLKDVFSGVVLAIGMALSSYLAQIMTIGFDWQTLLVAVGGAFVGYFVKTVPHGAKK